MKQSLTPIITVLFTLTLILDIECGRSGLYVCPDSFLLTWIELPPYTETANGTKDGVLFRTFKIGMQSCCVPRSDRTPTPFVFSGLNIDQLMTNESTTRLVPFMLPVQRSKEARAFLGHPYVPVISSPGFALFVKPRGNSFDILLRALRPVLPVFLISIIFVAIAGVLFWMIEFAAAIRNGESPEPFSPGVWNGVWWAFTTMTTVGYGDVRPKSREGKVFAVIWVFAGIVMSGLVVSTIVSVLINALSPKVVKLMNQKVAVLQDSEEAKFSFKKQGITHEFSNVTQISTALETDQVNMAVIDVLIAARHHDQFKEFVLDRIIEEEKTRGVVFLPGGAKYSPCFREYILNKQREIIDNTSKILKGSTYKSYSPVSPASIIPSIPIMHYTLLCILALILLPFISWMLKDWLAVCVASSDKKVLDSTHEARLLKECKQAYLCDLVDFLEVLKKNCQDDMETLRKSEEACACNEKSANKLTHDQEHVSLE